MKLIGLRVNLHIDFENIKRGDENMGSSSTDYSSHSA